VHNPSQPDDILYFSEEFKDSLDKIQTQLFNDSNIWRVPRSVYLLRSDRERVAEQNNESLPFTHSMNLACLRVAERADPKLMLKQRALFQTFSELTFTSKTFVNCLFKPQQQILRNLNKYYPVLKYLYISLQESQLKLMAH
jgi:hypothetical protein